MSDSFVNFEKSVENMNQFSGVQKADGVKAKKSKQGE
jgi:hypothetical protein